MGVIFLGEWSYHYIKKFIPQNNQTLELPLYSEINSENPQSQKGNDRILIPKREIYVIYCCYHKKQMWV